MTSTISNIIARIESEKSRLGIRLYNKASITDIAYFEKRKRIILPDDFKMLYSFCNGFESSEDMFRIIPLNEILENSYDSYLDGQADFHFAEYMIYCDMWSIATNKQNANNYLIYNKTTTSVILTNSIAEFLDRFLSGGVFEGLYKWRDAIEKTTK